MIYKVLPRQQQVLQKWETAIPSEPTIGRSPRALIDDMGTPRHAFIGEFVEIGLRDARLYLTLFSVLGDVGDRSGCRCSARPGSGRLERQFFMRKPFALRAAVWRR
jgi:hypothetical protein